MNKILSLMVLCVLGACDGKSRDLHGGGPEGPSPTVPSTEATKAAPDSAAIGSENQAGVMIGPSSDRTDEAQAKSVLTFQTWNQVSMGKSLKHQVREQPDGTMESVIAYTALDGARSFVMEVPYRGTAAEGSFERGGYLWVGDDGSQRISAKSGKFAIGAVTNGKLTIELKDLVMQVEGNELSQSVESGKLSGTLSRRCIVLDRSVANVISSDQGAGPLNMREDKAWSSDFCKSAMTELGITAMP